jgi:glycerate kinase
VRVLVALDKFKGALSAEEACAIAAEALRGSGAPLDVATCPLTDGGDGFAAILTDAVGGTRVEVEVTGPDGGRRRAAFGLVESGRVPAAARRRLGLDTGAAARIAVIEMAAASGLAGLDPARRDPWQSASTGTGELLRAAADRGAECLVVGLGGSATNDLGLPALAALGWTFLDGDGGAVSPPVPARWAAIRRIAGRPPPGFPPIRVACDVENPLVGPHGATVVFGPQKGLRPEDRGCMEEAVARMALMLCAQAGRPAELTAAPGAGAAGGLGFGLMAAFGATLVAGSALVADWLDLDRRVGWADVVITGEGRFDDSSLSGKGPGAVIGRARGKPVWVFAGEVGIPRERVASTVRLHAVNPPGMPLAQAIGRSRQHLALSLAAISHELAHLR